MILFTNITLRIKGLTINFDKVGKPALGNKVSGKDENYYTSRSDMHLRTRRDTPWADHIWTLKLSACCAVMSLPARLLMLAFLSPKIFTLYAVCADAARIVTKGVSVTVTVVFCVAGNGGTLQL